MHVDRPGFDALRARVAPHFPEELVAIDRSATRFDEEGEELAISLGELAATVGEGGRPRRITTETSNDVVPSWSRNGRFVYFASNRTGTRPEIWKAPVAGGEAQQVTKQGGFAAFESPDGKYLYYAKLDVAGLWRIPVEGGQESLVLDQLKPRQWGYWAVTDDGIYFINSESEPHVGRWLGSP